MPSRTKRDAKRTNSPSNAYFVYHYPIPQSIQTVANANPRSQDAVRNPHVAQLTTAP